MNSNGDFLSHMNAQSGFSQQAHDTHESDPTYNTIDANQFDPGNFFVDSLGNDDTNWDSFLPNDPIFMDQGGYAMESFPTSLSSTTQDDMGNHTTPDTIISTGGIQVNGSMGAKSRHNSIGVIPEQVAQEMEPGMVTTANMATSMTATTSMAAPANKMPTYGMTTSPSHRLFHWPPKNQNGQTQYRFVERHEMPRVTPEMLQQYDQDRQQNAFQAPESWNSWIYKERQNSEGNAETPPQTSGSGKLTQASQLGQQPQPNLDPQQYRQLQRHLQLQQQFQQNQQLQNPQVPPNQYQQSQYFPQPQQQQSLQHHQHPQQRQNPQHPQITQYVQNPQHPHYSQEFYSSQQAQHGQNLQSFYNPQSNMPYQQNPQPISQPTPMPASHALADTRGCPPLSVPIGPEVFLTAEGYQSNREKKPPQGKKPPWDGSTNHTRTTWNRDLYSDVLSSAGLPSTESPHLKPVEQSDIMLGMSSQRAVREAIKAGFARGAAWCLKTLTGDLNKELRDNKTMFGFQPANKDRKIDVVSKAMVGQFVSTNPPSVPAAKAAEMIAWSFDGYYPGVFYQEGSHGKPRTAQEIEDAWTELRATAVPTQLKPTLYNSSTGIITLTAEQPPQPPVATVRLAGKEAQGSSQTPIIKVAQFPSTGKAKNTSVVPNGEKFFTNPEVPTTMARQQKRKASADVGKKTGAKQSELTAEEKKENRNRKQDEKIRWTLTGQVRRIEFEGKNSTTYGCSDGQFRLLEPARLLAAQERTRKRKDDLERRKKAMAAAAGMPSTDAGATPTSKDAGQAPASKDAGPVLTSKDADLVQTSIPADGRGAEEDPTGQAGDLVQQYQDLLGQPALNSVGAGAIRRRRMPDAESVSGARKRARQDAQQALRKSSNGDQMLWDPLEKGSTAGELMAWNLDGTVNSTNTYRETSE